MDLWARWLVLGVACVAIVLAAMRYEERILSALMKASRGSGWRALGVVLGYHAALLLGCLLAAVVVIVVEESIASPVPTVVLTGLALALLGPFAVPLMPRQGQSATATRRLRERQTAGRSRDGRAAPLVLGIGGAILWFVLIFPTVAAVVVIFTAQ